MTDKFQKALTSIDYGLIIAILIPIIGILPMFGEGLANGADAPFHAHRIFAMAELIQDGNLYPRWVSYFHMGYGYPVFNFYAPGATHIGAWIHLLGFDVVTAYNLTNALAWMIGSVGIYWLARTFLSVRLALLACVLWVYAPSRFYEFWWQGSIAQIVATSFIPYVFYGIIRTTKFPTLRNSLWIAIPFALIVLSHTPTTYMTAIFVALFCFLAPLPMKSFREIIRRWIYIGCGLAISAGLSAIFLIPVFAELQYVRIAGELPDTIAFLQARFGTFSETFSLLPLVDTTDATLVMPRTLGLVGGVLSIIGLIALLVRRKWLIAIVLCLGLVFAVFLALEQSLDLWLLIPSFRNLRFPERILRVGTVFIALLGASSLLLIPKRWHLAGLVGLSALVIGQALPIMHPRDDDRVWENLSALDEIKMEAREQNWGTTAYDEYEPVWGEVTRFDMPSDAETYIDHPFRIRFLESDYLVETDNISYEHLSDNQLRVEIEANDLPMRMRQFYFPGWQVTLDGEPFPIDIDERYGLIELNIPNGEHVIQLDYVGTPVQHISTLITVLSVLGCVILVWRSSSSVSVVWNRDESGLSSKTMLIMSIVLLGFAVLNTAWLQDNVFRIQSPPDEPHYMQTPVHETFDDTVTLLGYSFDDDYVSSSNPLGIRLYWKIDAPTNEEYRPVVQLVNLTVSDSWAVSQPLEFEGGKLDEISPTQFMSDYHSLGLFDNVPPYVAQVMIQLERIEPDQAIKTTLPDGRDRLILPELIYINSPSKTYNGESIDVRLGDVVTVNCIGLRTEANDYVIDLWWTVTGDIPTDYKLFVHGLNSDGDIAQQRDIFLLDSLYPTSLWRVGQTFTDSITLPFDETITTIAIGLYNPEDNTRLPVSDGDVQSDRMTIPIEDITCPA